MSTVLITDSFVESILRALNIESDSETKSIAHHILESSQANLQWAFSSHQQRNIIEMNSVGHELGPEFGTPHRNAASVPSYQDLFSPDLRTDAPSHGRLSTHLPLSIPKIHLQSHTRKRCRSEEDSEMHITVITTKPDGTKITQKKGDTEENVREPSIPLDHTVDGWHLYYALKKEKYMQNEPHNSEQAYHAIYQRWSALPEEMKEHFQRRAGKKKTQQDKDKKE